MFLQNLGWLDCAYSNKKTTARYPPSPAVSGRLELAGDGVLNQQKLHLLRQGLHLSGGISCCAIYSA
jgi:hypothetical protein